MNLQDSSPIRDEPWLEVVDEAIGMEELFMAHQFAKYVEYVAQAGKDAYALPLYINAWLNHDENRDPLFFRDTGYGYRLGTKPSRDAVSTILDIWHMFAPSLDFIAPDLYSNDYETTCKAFRHHSQPLFIPEQRRDKIGARRVWHAIGSHQALGAAPFGIDTVEAEHG